MENKSKFTQSLDGIISKVKEVTTNVYLSQNPSTLLFGNDHIEVLNSKLNEHNYRIVKNDLKSESISIPNVTLYVVDKLKPIIHATGWKKAVQFLSNPVEKTLFETEDTKELQNYLNKNFSKELGFDTSKPAEPVRRDLQIPVYQPKPQVATKAPKKSFDRDM